jgi:hypothetical protein
VDRIYSTTVIMNRLSAIHELVAPGVALYSLVTSLSPTPGFADGLQRIFNAASSCFNRSNLAKSKPMGFLSFSCFKALRAAFKQFS